MSCDLFAVIPQPGTYPGQPTACAEVPGAELARSRPNVDGSIECNIAQLSTAGGAAPTGMGWYYDDFTAHNLTRCGSGGQHIAFPRGATPPLWTSVELDCQVTCTTTADCPLYMVCASTSAGHVCVEPSCVDGA